jgi:hypothetical protein
LVNFRYIEDYAAQIISLRDEIAGKKRQEQQVIFENYKKQFVVNFLNTDNPADVRGLLNNLKDYGDNAVRYFRLTKYIYIHGGGFYIDLEPRRSVEIGSLLASDNGQSQTFSSREDYLAYISDILQPKLPWETIERYREIILNLVKDISDYEEVLHKGHLKITDYQNLDEAYLKNYIIELRTYRGGLQNELNHAESQNPDRINNYIEKLVNIYKETDKPIMLEKYSALGLNALNDSLKIRPNYPVGDDNEPTFTAPANTPDIECFYQNFNAICEVTMLTGRDQWYNEGQPVMRHLRDFENKYPDKTAYCLFIAPNIHRDTLNTFWTAIKYEYEGKKQKIIPLSISNYVTLLNILVKIKTGIKFLKHNDLGHLYDEIINSSSAYPDSGEWYKNIPYIISSWQQQIIS